MHYGDLAIVGEHNLHGIAVNRPLDDRLTRGKSRYDERGWGGGDGWGGRYRRCGCRCGCWGLCVELRGQDGEQQNKNRADANELAVA